VINEGDCDADVDAYLKKHPAPVNPEAGLETPFAIYPNNYLNAAYPSTTSLSTG